VLNRIPVGILMSAVGAAGATILGAQGIAAADPPPPPDINAYPSAKPSEYSVMDGASYAFTVPDGITCVMDKQAGAYGCSGPIPAAPGGANMVTGTVKGSPGFASAGRPLYDGLEGVKPLAPNTRLSFRTVSCGTDGVTTSCVNAADQSGFVLSPAGSFTFG
jgi:hypothetical protein